MAHSNPNVVIAAAVVTVAAAGSAYAAEPLLLCGSRITGPDGSSASASAFIKSDQIELTRASLDVTFLRLDPPRPFPMTGLVFSYDIKVVEPLSATVNSIGLMYNSGGAPKECGPGVAIIEADGAEVYRAPYHATRGMCATSIDLERNEPGTSRAMDRILDAKTISVRFATDDGTSVLGDTFKGIAPEARLSTLNAAFANLVGRGNETPTCQKATFETFERLLPFRWVTLPH